MLGLVPMKDPISADVMTELAALFSSYLCSTSGGNKEVLKLTRGVYGAKGDGPVPVPVPVVVSDSSVVGVAGVPGVDAGGG